MLRLARRSVMGALALAAALAMRAIRPIVVVRIGPLKSARIGPFAGIPEMYLCRRDAGDYGPRTFDVFFNGQTISNQQLKVMWDRRLHVWQFSRMVNRVSSALPGAQAHMIPPISLRDTRGLLATFPPHLAFTPEEEERGQQALRAMGVPPDADFVCFHARDRTYLQALHPERDWSYHDFRDWPIADCMAAVQNLARRGRFAFRMGAVVQEPLPTHNGMIIDYAVTHRTEFMDIYLGAKCRFFLSSGSGIDTVARIFRRPSAMVNSIPIEGVSTWGPNDLFIPQKLWLRDEKRFLTFREMLDSAIGRFQSTEQYERHGLEPVRNTPEEIESLAVEMDERLSGTWKRSDEDDELQRRFWLLFKPSHLNGVFLSRIGAEFLRQNSQLLD